MALLLGALGGVLSALSHEAGITAAKKLERIEAEQLLPGETINLSEDELNSYLKYQYAPEMPAGVRDVRVNIRSDSGVVEAYVDVAKLQRDNASPLGMLGAMLFDGEQHIKAQCRYTSAEGQGNIEVESVEIDGRPLPKFVLDWLIANVVQPHVRYFVVGEPAPLPAKVRQIRLEPGHALVTSY